MKNLTPYTVEKLIKLSFRRYIRSIYNNFFHQTQKFYWTNRIGSNRLQWGSSPVEFRQKMGLMEKIIINWPYIYSEREFYQLFNGIWGQIFHFGEKFLWIKTWRVVYVPWQGKIVNIRQSKHLAITSELLNEKDKK